MSKNTLHEIGSNAAFVYVPWNVPSLCVQVSGNYLNLMSRSLDSGYDEWEYVDHPDIVNPIHHNLGRKIDSGVHDGLYGADAAQLLDACQKFVDESFRVLRSVMK